MKWIKFVMGIASLSFWAMFPTLILGIWITSIKDIAIKALKTEAIVFLFFLLMYMGMDDD